MRSILLPSTACAVALLVAGASFCPADTTPPRVSITVESAGPAGSFPMLSWPSRPGHVYRVQGRDSLASTGSWETIEPVLATSNVAQWRGRSIPENSIEFYQLALPEPEIFRLEPPVGPASGGGTLYLVGQCLDPNGMVRIGGLVIPPATVQAGSLYSFTAPALAEGVYDVEWLEKGQVTARAEKLYSVTGQPLPVGQRLLEPPEEPPASPRRTRTGNVIILDDDPEVAALKVKEKGNRTKCTSNLRLIPSTGEFRLEEVDLFIPGRGLDFMWTRTYRSRTGTNSPMGVNWDHSYNIRATSWNDATGHFDLWDGTGRIDRFFRGTNGTYTRDEFFCEGRVSNNTLTVTFPDSGRWEFLPFDGSVPAGKIARIVDRNGNALRFGYDVQGQCQNIVDTLGRTNRLSYDASGFITALTDFTGRQVSYGYARTIGGLTPPGVLTAVTNPPVIGTPHGNDFPKGKTTRYSYSQGFADERLNRNLASVTDGKDQVWLQVVYRTNTDPASVAFDNVDYVQRGTYRTKLRRGPQMPAPSNSFTAVKCILNDGAGNVSEHFYDALNRCVRRLDYTGRANPDLPTTEAQNRPVNKLRQDDPDFFETRFEWNPDSLCTRVVHPRGNETRFIYGREYSRVINVRKKGDLRVLRELACCGGADLDGDGKADVTERTVRFEHDARFGSDLRPWLTLVAADQRALVHQELHRPPMMLGFARSVTDARGRTTVCTYDPSGNLMEVRHPSPIGAENFEHNAFGQRTAHVHFADAEGRRQRDEFLYYSSGAQNGYLREGVKDCLAAGFHVTNRFEYDDLGRLTRHIDPRGFDMLWTYNALDQVVTRQTPNTSFGSLVRYATFFTYDAADNVVQVDHENRDETGALAAANPHWTSFAEYDLLNRQILLGHELAHVVQQRSMTNRFFYDANDNLILEQLPEAVSGADPNNVVASQYDERNLLFQVLPAPGTGLGATDRYDYDANGNCRRVSKVDAFTIKQTVIEFDGFDRAVRVTDALGNVESFAFDANDNLTYNRFDGETNDVVGSVGNRRLREARYEYDGMNRRVRRIGSFFDVFTELALSDGTSITRFLYAPNGQTTRETDDNGHSTVYRYDSVGRLSGVSRGVIEAGPFEEGVQRFAYSYDAAGNLISVTQTDRSDIGGTLQNFVTTHEYDGLGRLVRRVDNVGNTNVFAYDSRDLCVSEIDPNGNETVRVFDGLGRCVQTTAYEGTARGITINTSHVEYSNKRCVRTTDGNGNVTTYAFDSLDRHVATMDPDGTTVSLVWSPRSNLERLTDANGTVIQYTHDLLDRCVRKDITPAAGVEATTTFEAFAYDGLSHLVFGTNNTSMVEFTYSCSPNREEMATREKAKADCIAAVARHDGEGNRLSLTYSDGREVRYDYDVLDRMTNVSQIVGGRVSQLAGYAYDGPGRLTRVARANGINTRISWDGLQNFPNAPGDSGWQQVSRINHARGGANPAVIDQRIQAYDPGQNKILRAQTAPFVQGGPMTTNAFAYDRLHRLLRGRRSHGAVVESDNTYVLDAMGNRTNVIGLGSTGVYDMDPALPEPGDFQMNQYTFTPFGQHQYDRNGNVIFIDSPTGGTMFHYDYADRLVRVERAVGPAFVPVVNFTYDALGRRITRTSYLPSPMMPVTTRFLHDPESDGDGIIEFQEGGVPVASFVLPEVDDEVLVVFTPSGAPIYFHQDELGSVLALTDDKGDVLERYEYDDYGAPSFLDSKGAPLTGAGGVPVAESPLGNPFLFRGMFWDGELGLYHQGHSQGGTVGPFNPKTGRYHKRPGRVKYGDITLKRSGYTFADDNPWTLAVHDSSAGPGTESAPMLRGRVTSRSDTYVWKLSGRSKEDVYVWKVGQRSKSKEDVYVWKVRGRSKEDVYVWKIKGRAAAAKQDVYVWKLKKEEGGRHTPFHNKYRPQFFDRTTDVTGEIELESGREMSASVTGDNTPIIRGSALGGLNKDPKWVGKSSVTGIEMFRKILDRGEAGDNVGLLLRQADLSGIRGHRDVGGYRAAGPGSGVTITVKLINPIAMDKGLRFAIREGGRTVGAGQVIEIIK